MAPRNRQVDSLRAKGKSVLKSPSGHDVISDCELEPSMLRGVPAPAHANHGQEIFQRRVQRGPNYKIHV